MNKKILNALEIACANITPSDLNTLKKEINQFLLTKIVFKKDKSSDEKLMEIRELEIAKLYLDRKKMSEISLEVGLNQSSIRAIIKKIKIQLLAYLKEEKDLFISLSHLDQVLISRNLRQECLEHLEQRQNIKSEYWQLKRMPMGLDTAIQDAFLSTRTQNCLTAYGFSTMREVSEAKEITLRKIKNFGSKGLAEIQLFISTNQDIDSEVMAKSKKLSRAYIREPKPNIVLNQDHAFKLKKDKLENKNKLIKQI